MKNKKLIRIILVVTMAVLVLAGSVTGIVFAAKAAKTEKLVIYNWADYIDPTVLDDFVDYYYEKTGKTIEVVYSLFDTNETMMTEITKGDSQIDLICPSEYSIQKLMNKGLLQKLDMTADEYEYIDNVYPAIRSKVAEVFPADANGVSMNDYFVPYMWGTLGILYNTKFVTEDDLAKGWGLLWNAGNNPVLEGKILMKDSVRDAYAATVTYLKEYGYLAEFDAANGTDYDNYSIEKLINLVDDNLLKMCETALTAQRKQLKGYEVDFGKDDMINEVAYVDLAWSGDAMYAIEEGGYDEETDTYQLDYFVPETGGNVWFDGWAMPTTAQNVSAAKEFINFLCRPDIAMRNMMEIGYSCSFNPENFQNNHDEYTEAAIEYLVECEYAWEIDAEEIAELYPENDGILYTVGEGEEAVTYDLTDFFTDERRYPDFADPEVSETLGVMQDFGAENDKVVSMWERVKGGNEFPWELVVTLVGIIGAIALIVGGIHVVKLLKSKRRLVIVTPKTAD